MHRVWRPGVLLGLAYLGFLGLGLRSGLLGVAWPSIRADFDLQLDALGALLGPGSIGWAARNELVARLLGYRRDVQPLPDDGGVVQRPRLALGLCHRRVTHTGPWQRVLADAVRLAQPR